MSEQLTFSQSDVIDKPVVFKREKSALFGAVAVA